VGRFLETVQEIIAGTVVDVANVGRAGWIVAVVVADDAAGT
jgi:hypothetical protein